MIALNQSPDAPAASQFDRCLRDQDMGERDTPALHPPPEPGVPHSRVAILARPTAPGGAHAERNLQRHFWPFVRNPPPGLGVGWSRAAVSGSETGGKQPSVLRLIAPPIPTPAMGRSPNPNVPTSILAKRRGALRASSDRPPKFRTFNGRNGRKTCRREGRDLRNVFATRRTFALSRLCPLGCAHAQDNIPCTCG